MALNDDRYTLDMILRALLGAPWRLVNSLKLIEEQYGLAIKFHWLGMYIEISSGNMLIDGLISLFPSTGTRPSYAYGYVSFIEEYEKWLNHR